MNNENNTNNQTNVGGFNQNMDPFKINQNPAQMPNNTGMAPEPQPMMNPGFNEATNPGPTPMPNNMGMAPEPQPMMNPNPAPMPNNMGMASESQPMMNPGFNGEMNPNPNFNTSVNNQPNINPVNKSNTKTNSGGAILVILILIAIGVGGYFAYSSGIFSGVKKTLKCSEHKKSFGALIDNDFVMKIGDGTIAEFTMNQTWDLSNTSYTDEEMTDMIDTTSSSCQKENDCNFKYNYQKGKKLKMTTKYGKDGIKQIIPNTDYSNVKAKDLYDTLKSTYESMGYSCK